MVSFSRTDPRASLERVLQALGRTSTAEADGSAQVDEVDAADEVLEALLALQELREQMLGWEPLLIEAARDRGVSWARLAPALGVTSRQAAERRYLRLKPAGDEGLTREQRVLAARDERAGDRAVAAWARANASQLRQIAGQVSAAGGLSTSARGRARTLATSLTDDDPATLLTPLAQMHADLLDDHAQLAAQVDAVGRSVTRVREETRRRRQAGQP